MSDIAFLCHPTVGHLNTLLSTALRMKDDGHRTRFFIPGGPALPFRLRPDILNNVVDVPAMVDRAGLPLERLRPALGVIFHAIRLARSSGYEESRIALKLFTAGVEATTRDILRRLERQPADVLVTDFAFYPALLAAEKLGLPWAAVYHSGLPFRGPGIPPGAVACRSARRTVPSCGAPKRPRRSCSRSWPGGWARPGARSAWGRDRRTSCARPPRPGSTW